MVDARVVTWLVAAALLAGCAQPEGSKGTGSGAGALPGTLAGVVVDAAIRPLEGVAVSIPARPTVVPALTGADGRFVLLDVEPGTVVLAASKPGYLDVFVQSDPADPGVLQILLERLVETTPFFVLESYDGFIDCGLGSAPAFGLSANCMVLAGAALYAACTGADPVPPAGVCLDGTNPYYISAAQGNMSIAQTEVAWQPTVQGQSELAIGYYVMDGQGAIVGGISGGGGGPPPLLVHRINSTEIRDHQLGGAHHLALFVNPSYTTQATVVLQQSYRLFHTSTFYFEPPEAWVYVNDGPPMVPDVCTSCLAAGPA